MSTAVVNGYIEFWSTDYIEGWAYRPDGKPIELTVIYNGDQQMLVADWYSRPDVSEVYGPGAINSGFRCAFPEKLKERIVTEQKVPDSMAVVANDHHLDVLSGFRISERKKNELQRNNVVLNSLIAQGNRAAKDPISDLELRPLAVSACLRLSEKQLNVFHVLINGVELTRGVFLRVNDEHGAKPDVNGKVEVAITVDLPGYIWADFGGSKAVRVEFCLQDKPVTGGQINIVLDDLAGWLEEIASPTNQSTNQHKVLLALEHIKHAAIFPRLSPAAQEYFLRASREFKLEEYLLKVFSNYSQCQTSQENWQISPQTFALWRALKELNMRMNTGDEVLSEKVEHTRLAVDLSDEVWINFIKSVIPLFCRKDELLELKKIVNFASLHGMANSSDLWEASLSIAVLAADRKIKAASDAAWRLGGFINQGWFSSESLYFAVAHTNKLDAARLVDAKEVEGFRYAVLGLFDALGSGWFSRLHDELIVRSMIELIESSGMTTNYYLNDLFNAAIKHFGLNPLFWRYVEQHGRIFENWNLQYAYEQWLPVRDYFDRIAGTQRGAHGRDRNKVLRCLRYFESKENPQAIQFLRECLQYELHRSHAQDIVGLLDDAFSVFEAMSIDDIIRVYSDPLVPDSCLSKTSAFDAFKRLIVERLRVRSSHTHSVNFAAQVDAAHAVKEIYDLLKGDAFNDTKALESRLGALMTTNIPAMLYLGTDLLATVLRGVVTLRKPALNDRLLLEINKALRSADRDCSTKLPATPLSTAVTTVRQISPDAFSQGVLADFRSMTGGDRFGVSVSTTPQLKIDSDSMSYANDLIVCIYSCRKYLGDRVQKIRDTWIKDLERTGIRYVIVVGDGDDTLHGDVLQLRVSDAYEDLPQKTLRMFHWVYNHTDFSFALKIDDDCFLNIEGFLESLSYRKHHYYGRRIDRAIGSMDRVWHHAKSSDEQARRSLDKSPEPSSYADGGGGYTLSRLAMAKLLEQSDSAEGRRLIAASFMEDKLVGDLLAHAGIEPCDEDYECYQRRRTYADAVPVGMWENIYHPTKISPTVVVHLDSAEDQARVSAVSQSEVLTPKRIWATFESPRIGLNSNALELLSSGEKLKLLGTSRFVAIAVCRNEMTMLPHFLDHYRRAGVDCFLVADNCSSDGSREYLLSQADVIVFSVDTEYRCSHYGVTWQQSLLANFCHGKWVIVADVDELLVYPGMEQAMVTDFLANVEYQGRDCVRVEMIDMYPFSDLQDADFSVAEPFDAACWFDKRPLTKWRLGGGRFSNHMTAVSSFRHRIDCNAEPNAFSSQKFALVRYKPWMRFSEGFHDSVGTKVADEVLYFAHFKYHAGFEAKVKTEIARGQHFDNAKEYRRYAAMLAEAKGSFGAEGVSVKYAGFAGFRDSA